MPLYEYRCESCGEREERLESISAPTEHDCGKCGGASAMKRQISRTAFNLAGGGWYSQGYSMPAPAAAKTEAAPKGGCAGGCACHSGSKDR